MRFTADAVALCDDVTRINHGHVEIRLMLRDPRIEVFVGVFASLDSGYAFYAPGDNGLCTIHDNTCGRRADGLQSRGAKAVYGCPCNG